MRRSLTTLTIGALLLACAPLRASDPSDLVLDRFGEYLEALRTQAGIPGLAAAIVGSDDLIWTQGFGQQDVERSVRVRPDTPFHLDGLTQLVTASLVLRCAQEGRLSLDDRVEQFAPGSSDAQLTLRQILSHVSGSSSNPTFAYRPDRLNVLAAVVRACTSDSFRENVADWLDRLAMVSSVPGPDVIRLQPPAEGIPTPEDRDRYARILQRLAVPYSVDSRGRPSPSSYPATTLTPSSGLVASAGDVAQFVLALKQHMLLREETLDLAWRVPVAADGRRLPHGLGWFVQIYNGEMIVWQIGVADNASSSLLVTIAGRGITLVLLANSDGLVKTFPLTAGDVTVSPFARLFLGTFVR